MKLLFLHHQQRRHYKDEPGYNDLFRPFTKARQVTGWDEFVYQTPLRQFMLYELAGRGKRPSGDPSQFILANFSAEIYEAASLAMLPLLTQAVEIAEPDLIVYPLTWPTETIHPAVLRQIKAVRGSRLFVQLWDHQEGDMFFHSVERETIKVADFYAVSDNFGRLARLRERQPPYAEYTNLEAVHWLPTICDPDIYRPLDLPKTTEIALFGSSEASRRDMIAALTLRYGPRFRHLGGHFASDQFLTLEQYIQGLNQTRIVVNTQTFMERIQLKARVREVLSCGAFLLEQDNEESRRFLEGSGVVLFGSYPDLFAKIDYYLAHDEERESLARQAHEWYRARYSPDRAMQQVVDALMR